MTGDDLPGMPDVPSQVVSALRKDASQININRDLNGLKSGRGIAFGTRGRCDYR